MALVVVHVSNRKNDLAAGLGVWLPVRCSTVWMLRRSLAGISGALDQ